MFNNHPLLVKVASLLIFFICKCQLLVFVSERDSNPRPLPSPFSLQPPSQPYNSSLLKVFWNWFTDDLYVLHLWCIYHNVVGCWVQQTSGFIKTRGIRRHDCFCMSETYWYISPTSRAEDCFCYPAWLTSSDRFARSS